MFDKLRQSIGVPPGQSQIQQPNKPPVTLISHIVHLAAAPPDGSPHPVWNANSKFDQLMWASLPDEFKQVRSPSSLAFRLSHSCPQRQINYSIVTIRPIPRFKEIFQSVRIFAHFFNVVSLTVLKTNSTDATTPWFDVAPNHTVMLSGFPPKGSCIPNHPQITNSTIPGLKRQTEATTPTPDPKRARQDSATKPASGASPSEPAPSSESTTPTTNPATVPNPPSITSMPAAKQQEFMEKYLKLQSEIKREWAVLQKAQTDGIPPEVLLPMKTDLGKKLEIYKRLSAILPVPKNLPTPTGVAPGPSSQPSPPVIATPTPTTTSATDPNPSNTVPPAPEPAQLSPPSSATTAEVQNQNVPNSILPPTEAIHHPTQPQNQQGTSFRLSLFSSPLSTHRWHRPITRGKQPRHGTPARPTTTMAWHVFFGDCEWCTRGYHLRICRVPTERRTVSDVAFSNH